MSWIRQSLLVLTLMLSGFSQAQVSIDSSLLQESEVLVLHTLRGDVFFGFVRNITADSISFETQDGLRFQVSRASIQWLGPAREARWLQSGNSPYKEHFSSSENKYLIQYENLTYSFTAIPYPKGLAEYRNIDLLFNTIDVGIGEHVSVGGGMFVPLIFVLRGKAGFPVGNKLHLGLGINNFVGLGPIEGLIVHYFGIATVGDLHRNFNVTFGNISDWTEPEDNINLATFGGSLAFSDRWRIYADIGMSLGEAGIVPSVVMSWAHRRNRVELGLLGVWDGFFEPLPILSYAHRF